MIYLILFSFLCIVSVQTICMPTKSDCILGFQILHSSLNNQLPPPFSLSDDSCGLFITYKKQGMLRGCIGTFDQSPVSTNFKRIVLDAAFNDRRFPPIKLKEFSDLEIEVSFLTNFEQKEEAYDFVIGKHGIIFQLNYENKVYLSTFLPEVMVEQKWDNKETIKQLAKKSGWNGNINSILQDIKIITYETNFKTMEASEWLKMKQDL